MCNKISSIWLVSLAHYTPPTPIHALRICQSRAPFEPESARRGSREQRNPCNMPLPQRKTRQVGINLHTPFHPNAAFKLACSQKRHTTTPNRSDMISTPRFPPENAGPNSIAHHYALASRCPKPMPNPRRS